MQIKVEPTTKDRVALIINETTTLLKKSEAKKVRDALNTVLIAPKTALKATSTGGRKAKKITIDELRDHIQAAMEKHPDYDDLSGHLDRYAFQDLTPQIEKDLQKVDFDLENVMDETDDPEHLGYRMIGDLAVYALEAGGDWEWPVYFIFYWDGKKLRAYIPKDGNAWNYDTKKALGNDDTADSKFLAKFFNYKEGNQFFVDDGGAMVDHAKMEADIKKRIAVG